MKVVIVGAGNLATGVALEMHRVGITIGQVYSRTEESAAALAKRVGSVWTTDPGQVIDDTDLYLFALKDSALLEIISRIKPNKGLWVHTAKSVHMDVFKGHVERYGVFYPLQTFTRERPISLDGTWIFLELHAPEDEKMLKKVAQALSGKVQCLSSKKRKMLHLSAVFACNFTNHMYHLATKLVEEEGIPGEVLFPLIDETAAKIHTIPPADAQTGPAVRFDKTIIDNQLALLKDPAMKALYQLISQNIYKEKVVRNSSSQQLSS